MKTILLAIPDLFFSAKVNSVAQHLGIATLPTFTQHDLLSKAHGESAEMLLIDLEAEQLQPVESVRRLKTDEHTRKLRIVGYLSKSTPSLRQPAEEAGCDLVLGRMQLIESLPDVLDGSLLK